MTGSNALVWLDNPTAFTQDAAPEVPVGFGDATAPRPPDETVYWGERIAEQTVIELLEGFRTTGDPPVIRLAHRADLWRKLLGSGLSRQSLASFTAQITALQSFLTESSCTQAKSWALAARKTATPGYSIAEGNEPTQS